MTAVALGSVRAEAARVAAFLEGLSAGDWSRPTRCPPLTVHQLASHALRGVVRIREMFAAGAVDEQPEKDGATYFSYDPPAVRDEIVRRSIESSKDFPVEGFPARWRTEWRNVLDECATVLEREDPVLKGVFGLIHLSEYLRTRAVEVVVHSMDLRDALGLDPDPDPGALDVVCGVLADLLGTDPRVLGMDGVRFALLGTGRAQPDDGERKMLGPLTARLPVVS